MHPSICFGGSWRVGRLIKGSPVKFSVVCINLRPEESPLLSFSNRYLFCCGWQWSPAVNCDMITSINVLAHYNKEGYLNNGRLLSVASFGFLIFSQICDAFVEAMKKKRRLGSKERKKGKVRKENIIKRNIKTRKKIEKEIDIFR